MYQQTKDYKAASDARSKKRRDLRDKISLAAQRRENKPIYDKYAGIKFTRSREKYYREHKQAIDTYQIAVRKLKPHLTAEGKIPLKRWERELEELDEGIASDPGRDTYKAIVEEMKLVSKIENYAKAVMKDRGLTPEQKAQKQLKIMKRRQISHDDECRF